MCPNTPNYYPPPYNISHNISNKNLKPILKTVVKVLPDKYFSIILQYYEEILPLFAKKKQYEN